MSQDEEQLQQNVQIGSAAAAVSTNAEISETPTRPFKITMEFPLFISILTTSLCGAAISNIILYRTCVHALNHTSDECIGFLSLDKANQSKNLEEEVQKYATFVSTLRSVLESVAPAILSLFLAVWSDTHGRKPLVVWPLLGLAMSGMLMVVYAMLDNLGPWWYILTVVPYSLSGGFTMLFTGAFCYISDITTEEKRSIRMTILESAVGLGSFVGSISSSYLLRAVGNVYLLLIAATLNVIAYAFTNVWVKESLTGAVQGSFSSVLDFLLVKEMFRECFKRRPNNGRAQILLLTFANSLSIFILYGLMSLEYLYTRDKLHWAIKDYTLFSAASTAIAFVGSFLGVIVGQKWLRISDLSFATISFVSTASDYLVKTLAVTSWHMYFGSAISMFRGLSAPLLRSMLTKILPVTDIAKVFALMSAIEGLCPLLAPIMYNSLYQITLFSFPAAIYVLSIGVTLICIICTSVVHHYRWNITSPYQRLEDF